MGKHCQEKLGNLGKTACKNSENTQVLLGNI